MKISMITSLVLTCLLTAIGLSQGPASQGPASQEPASQEPASQEPAPAAETSHGPAPAAETPEVRPAEVQLAAVPPILRMHLPILGPNLGVLVESVAPDSSAAKAGLRAGDVLMEAGGRKVIAGDPLEALDQLAPLVVIRRGRIRPLPFASQGRWPIGIDSWGPLPGQPFAPGRGRAITSATASTFGGPPGALNRATSISRAGDQISLEMSIPGVASGPVRFQGSEAEIERQLQESALSEAAKQEVRAALRQVR